MRSLYGVEGSLELIGCAPPGFPWGSTSRASVRGKAGVLRLRGCFATRSNHFAQDDRETSGNLSFGQLSYQLQIGFQEIEGGKLAANRPAHVFENPVLDFAFVLAHRVEAQFDG